MKQQTFSDIEYGSRKRKTKREAFLGTQKVSSSSAISLLKSRFLPRFAAIFLAEIVVNNL